MSDSPVPPQVALVGFGPWGRNIARVLHQLGALAGVCDPDPAARAVANNAYPGLPTWASSEEVPVQLAVAIASPAALHAQQAQWFLRRGQHVFVEKPIALQVDDCPRLLQLARQNKLVLMVGHLLHHHPAVVTLDRLVQQGALGRLQYLYSNRLNLGRFRREENSLWSFAPHDIAVMLRLVGASPQRVTATGGYFLHAHIADTTMTTLAWDQGVQAHIHVSWLHPFKEQRLVVVGQDAMAVFDDQQPWASKLTLFRHGVDWKDGVPSPRRAEPEAVSLPQLEPLREEMSAFLRAIADPEAPIVADGAEATRVLRVLDAAERSLQQAGVPVTLSPAAGAAVDADAADVAPDWHKAGVTVHPSAVVGQGAAVGFGSKVWHFSHVMKGAVVGRDCVLGQNSFVQEGAVLGDRVRLQNNVSVYAGVELGDDVFCGPSCVFTNVVRPRAHVSRKDEFAATLVGNGATLGANATIVCGTRIGRFAFVAAGAVVTRDVPAHGLVSGNPARLRGWVCSCGEKLPWPVAPHSTDAAVCQRCRLAWQWDGQAVTEAKKA